MINIKSFVFILLTSLNCLFSYAQKQKKRQYVPTPISTLLYDNFNYSPFIKSVQITVHDKENGFLIIDLNKNESFTINFDDLRADIRSYYYTVTYCSSDWTESRMPRMDYINGYEEDRIFENKNSKNTLIPYTHYSFTFPNANMQPKLAGNYLLKVYEDADSDRLIFTRKIYILNNKINITAEIIPAPQSINRTKNQKLNLVLNTNLELSNPNQNVQVHVFQNQRTDNVEIIRVATQVSPNTFTYNHPQSLDFKGNNEFRKVDLRSVQSASGRITQLTRDTVIFAKMDTDGRANNSNYHFQTDENGKFYIRNLDSQEPDIQSDYIYTFFSLKDSTNIKGDIYLVGGFNNYNQTKENKLIYDQQSQSWTTIQLLKQGIYDYTYVNNLENKVLTDYYDGSFFETENDYQILVYYRKPGTYWDEIIGFKNINTTTK